MSPDELLTKKDLEKFKEELFEFLTPFKSGQVSQQQKWLRSKEVRAMLKISSGTLINLRVNGTLTVRLIRKIHYYKAEEIEKLLNVVEKKSPVRKI